MAELIFPDYNRSFYDNEQQGERLGAGIRNAQAFRSGGIQGVEDAAGRTGDLETQSYVQGMRQRSTQARDAHTQAAYDNLEKIRPLVLGAISRARQLPPEQRAQFLNMPQIRQRFMDSGISPEMYDQGIASVSNPATADQAFQSITSAFSQQREPSWTYRGTQVVGATPGIQGVDVGAGEVQTGGTLPPGAQPQMWTPEQVAAAHYAPGTVVYTDPTTGEPHVSQQPHYSSSHFGGTYPDDGYDYHGG